MTQVTDGCTALLQENYSYLVTQFNYQMMDSVSIALFCHESLVYIYTATVIKMMDTHSISCQTLFIHHKNVHNVNNQLPVWIFISVWKHELQSKCTSYTSSWDHCPFSYLCTFFKVLEKEWGLNLTKAKHWKDECCRVRELALTSLVEAVFLF